MKIVQSLAALCTQPLFAEAAAEGKAVPPFWKQRAAEQALRFHAARCRAVEHSWKALEVGLAGVSWWNRCKVLLEPGEDLALGDPIEAFLLRAPYVDLSEESRRDCVRELRAARAAGLLTEKGEHSSPTSDGWADLAMADEPSSIDDIAEALREANFTALAAVLGERAKGTPFLVDAARLFLRHALENDEVLSAGAPPVNGPGPDMHLAALAEVLNAHGSRLDLLLATLATAEAAPVAVPTAYPLDVSREANGHAEPVQRLAADVGALLAERRLTDRELRLTDSDSVRDEAVRRRIDELQSRAAMAEGDTKTLPALRNGLAILAALKGDYEEAQGELQAAAAVALDPFALAVVQFNAYRVALEQHDWAEALTFLERAATLWPARFAPLPADKYEAERILGVAGSGVAFLCRDRLAEDRVVVKALESDALEQDVNEIFRVARVLQEVDHRAFLPPRETDFAGAEQTRPYVVTDFIDGLTLAEHVVQYGPLSPDDLLQIARPLVEGLSQAHERGLLHRDLKPDNLVVRHENEQWQVKLFDLGLSLKPAVLCASLAGGRSAACASAIGALSYAAPEASGWIQGVPTGPYSDVYSFGKTCYFALLGTAEPDDDEKETLPPAWRKLLAACTARTVARRVPNFTLVRDRLAKMAKTAPAATPAAPETVADKPTGTPRGEVKRAEGYLERGMIFRQQNNPDQALAAFNRALEIDPTLIAGYIKRGNLYADRGDLNRAIADYSEAARIDPKSSLAYLNRGLAHAKQGAFDKVIADTSQAIELEPKLASAYFIRGAAYANRGERHRAIAEFTLAIRLDPKNPLAHNDRGLAFADQGEYDRAIADYTAALRLDPRLTLAYVNRGIAFRAKKNADRAIAEFSKALRLEPRNVPAYFNRGLAFLDKPDFDRAALDFERVLRLEPKHPEAAARRDEALKGKANSPPAEVPPKPPAVPRKQEKRPAVAPSAAQTAKQTQDEERRQVRAAAYFARGRGLYEKGEYAEAIDQFGKAIQIDPKDAQAFYQRGLSYVAQSEYAEAIADYDSALKISPRNHLAYYHRGIAHQLLGQHEKAIADYTRTLKLEPRMAVAYRHRGQAHQARGDTGRAQADFEEAQRLDPNAGKR